MKNIIALAIVGLVMVSALGMAGYTTKYIDESFDGTTLDTDIWQENGNISYSVTGGNLVINFEGTDDEAGIVSKPYTVTDGNIRGEIVFSISSASTQQEDYGSGVNVGTVFQEWDNTTTPDDSRIVGAMVGLSRYSTDYGWLYFGIRTGTTATEHIRTFEYENATTYFGKTINFRFVYDVDISGTKGTVHAELYMNDVKVEELDGHIYNITDQMSTGITVVQNTNAGNITPLDGDVKVDSIVLGKYTPEEEKQGVLPKFEVSISGELFLAVVLLVVAILLYGDKYLDNKGIDTMKIAKAFAVISLLLMTYVEYIRNATYYNIPLWIIPLALLVILILYWKGYIGKKKLI